MMNNVISYDDKIAFSEVYDIIMFMDYKERNKIPTRFIEFLKANKQADYITKINPYIPLEFQKISQTTQNIIAYIYRRYLANDEEKALFRVQEQKEFELERKSIENIFNNNKTTNPSTIQTNTEEKNLPIVVKKQNIFKRIINFIKKLF